MTSVAPNQPASEPQAKPKVLRRPAQFSRRAEAAEPPLPASTGGAASTPPFAAPESPARPTAIGRHWQEDGRFGTFLILCVALFNLLLALILPHTAAKETDAGPSTATLMNNAAMPSAMKQEDGHSVTVYSEPTNLDDDDARSMDLDALPDAHNDFSVSPGDIPAPTARALDD